MKMKRAVSAVLVLCLCLVLAGCSQDTAVYVQSVRTLGGMGGIAPGDRFPGMVVSEHVTEIQKDGDKSVKELMVKEGDDVTEGQELFSYDTDELKLALDKHQLELEQLHVTIESYQSQIDILQRERERAYGTERLQYTIELQSAQLELKEAEMKVKTKKTEVDNAGILLENATVTAPVSGRIQAISESGTDQYGDPVPYITIQQAGSYRVKGTLGELQRGGITEGTRMKLFSRTDKNTFWTGTVTLVDYESPSQGSDMDRYYGSSSDEMSSASKYPFYVELDSTDGMILGQHIYMELLTEEGEKAGVRISGAFLSYQEDGTPFVWAENRGKLDQRTVTLGEYDGMTDTYEILEGLTEDDYIAFPDPNLCKNGVPTTHDQVVEETEGQEVA